MLVQLDHQPVLIQLIHQAINQYHLDEHKHLIIALQAIESIEVKIINEILLLEHISKDNRYHSFIM